MSRRVRGSVVVITGASSGIGRATAEAFAREGARLVLAARNGRALREVARDCRRLGADAIAVRTDVSREREVRRLAGAAVERFGRIDTWVNNAAVSLFGRFDEIPPEDFRRVMEVNFFGTLYGARAAVREFRGQRPSVFGKGLLINITSTLGHVGGPYMSAYVASKFAVDGLSSSLRMENLHEDVDVCTVTPATIDTPIYQHSANYLGKAVEPMDPVYSPQRVARAIVRVARRPRPLTKVGHVGNLVRLLRVVSRNLTDRAVRYGFDEHLLQEDEAERTRGNLYRPLESEEKFGGGWRRTGEWPLRLGLIALGAAVLVGGAAAARGRLVSGRE